MLGTLGHFLMTDAQLTPTIRPTNRLGRRDTIWFKAYGLWAY